MCVLRGFGVRQTRISELRLSALEASTRVGLSQTATSRPRYDTWRTASLTRPKKDLFEDQIIETVWEEHVVYGGIADVTWESVACFNILGGGTAAGGAQRRGEKQKGNILFSFALTESLC